jgi:iron complex transport system permease protein
VSAAPWAALTPDRRRRVLLLSAAATLAAFAFALCAGTDGLHLPLNDGGAALGVRLPRVALAAIAGAALASAGAALQALLRNPLADPFVIGVSGGAALGGATVIALGAAAAAWVEGGAIAGAAASTLLLAWFLRRERSSTDATLLAGVVFNAFASAIITVLKTTLSAEKTQSMLFWLIGTIDYVTPATLAVVGVTVAAGIAVLLRHAGGLELLSLGPDEAARLGLDADRVRLWTYGAASLLVGAVVPVTGLIGFIGLVVPHALRITVSSDQRLLLPASALGGAAVLLVFDAAARLSFFLFDTELPTGALTALFGAPLFAWALARHLDDERERR